MQFNARVSLAVSPYQGEEWREEEFVTVTAESETEAESKIYDHYNDKGNPYSIMYHVNHIEFFIRID